MRKNRRLLDGTPLAIDVPDAVELPPETMIGVMRVDRLEVELTLAAPEAVEHFLATTGSTAGSPLRLRGGREVHLGDLGGDAGNGTVFVITVDDLRVFGSVPPGVSRADLTRWLGLISWVGRGNGLHAKLAAPAEWVRERPQAMAQIVTTQGADAYLLDIRAATGQARRPSVSGGVKVRGGRLYRSAKSDVRRHVILEAPDFVSYAIPLPATELDEVVASMADVITETP